MAVVIPSAVVRGLRGSVDNLSFQYWRKGVFTVKSKATIVNQPDTMPQTSIRAAMTVIVGSWKTTLTQAQREAWNSYAKLPRFVDSKAGGQLAIIRGSKNTGSGYHKFIELNMMRVSAAIAPPALIDDPPFDEIPPDAPTDFTAVWDAPPDNHVDIAWTEPATYPAGSRVRIWLRSPDAIYHPQIVFTQTPVTESAVITGGATVGGANQLFAPLPAGTQLYFQMDTVSPGGQTSPPTNTEIAVI